jgi:hypothetical protein
MVYEEFIPKNNNVKGNNALLTDLENKYLRAFDKFILYNTKHRTAYLNFVSINTDQRVNK